jgi:hypothetical protein
MSQFFGQAINGRVVALGAYFDQDVDGVVSRLVCEQLDDGGWNCEAENGSPRSSFATTINAGLSHRRSGRGASIQAAGRWQLAAGEHSSRQGPFSA